MMMNQAPSTVQHAGCMQKGNAAHTGTQEMYTRFWFGNITSSNESLDEWKKSVNLKCWT
jgi:hypothetical protein